MKNEEEQISEEHQQVLINILTSNLELFKDFIHQKSLMSYKKYLELKEKNNFDDEETIDNSLKKIYDYFEIDVYEKQPLIDYFFEFLPISSFFQKEEKVYSNEIVNISNYAIEISKLLKLEDKGYIDLGGTVASTDIKLFTESQLKKLKDRLENPYFPITTEREILITTRILEILETAVTNNDYRLFETMLIYEKSPIDLNSNFTELEELIYQQFKKFYTGIPTSKLELLKSFELFSISEYELRILSSNFNQLQFLNAIYKITEFIFAHDVKKAIKPKRNQLKISTQIFEPTMGIYDKTTINETKIFLTDRSRSTNYQEDAFEKHIEELITVTEDGDVIFNEEFKALLENYIPNPEEFYKTIHKNSKLTDKKTLSQLFSLKPQ